MRQLQESQLLKVQAEGQLGLQKRNQSPKNQAQAHRERVLVTVLPQNEVVSSIRYWQSDLTPVILIPARLLESASALDESLDVQNVFFGC